MEARFVPPIVDIAVANNAIIPMTPFLYLSFIGLGLLFSLFFFYLNHRYGLEERKSHLLIFFIIVYVMAFELYAYYLVQQGRQNVLVYNLFFVIGETLLILAYLNALIDQQRIKKALLFFIPCFLIWAAVNALFFQHPTAMFQHYTHLLGSFGIVALCCYLLYRIFLVDGYWDQPLLSVPHFWNIAAILLFYCPNFIYFGSINLLWDIDKWYLTVLASLNRIFAALLYLIFGLSFYSSLIFMRSGNGR
ncbi:hypothetical protein SAMN04488057_101185 [Cyclobacterium lianum]|uniref:Histidine kinase N-terminal 7TM region domain-containing protein n=1 Tax=Cyclobacterium lianum TaxID=388280 RepID=A0A1M7I4C3_9BACT|nr:hypothetical protein [Cyclobacterium lianum]SHM35632.1 hypothetical protein SAMN04488057_101185 [Cyclobacterium lianum]